ncbi:hemicentin-1-like isoform X2 [Anneissia japonica]|uniref:hemicentin-1-like isoform X2 n=1 Tax=Anneissia japonica TaxID=1529436 RepID=UPI0014256E9F|nr:hemicentin-1-like isoform X2 [Anneissia japonica]
MMDVFTLFQRICVIYLCIELTLVFGTNKNNRNLGSCEQLTLSDVCSNAGLPYSSTLLPNDFDHPDVSTAEGILLGEYLPLFNSGCSEYIRPFVCSVFFPECPQRRRQKGIKACKQFCEKAKEKCKGLFASYGQNWPAQFDCERFEPYKPKRSRKKGRDNCFNYIPPPPAFCSLPADIGPCNRLTGKFFYDAKFQMCRSFTYGGCAGNENRFETKEECESVCIKKGTGKNHLRNPPGNTATQPTIKHPTERQIGNDHDVILQDRVEITTTVEPANLFPTIPTNINRALLPPLIVFPPGDHLVKEFGMVTLMCRAAGPPPIEYSWNRLDGPMPEDKIIKEETFGVEAILIIGNVTRDDAGKYMCTAENFEGMVDSVAMVTVYSDVQIYPFVSSENIQENETIQFECNATGYPKPQLSWRRNNLPDEVITTNSILTIDAARTEDGGIYTCLASNKYSTASREVQVVVNVPIHISIDSSSTLKYGHTTSIECVLEGYPSIEVTWFNENQNRSVPIERFNSSEEFLSDKHIFRVTSNLIFHNITEMVAGKYSCYGSNRVGVNHRSTNIYVTGESCPLPKEVTNGVLEIKGLYHGSSHSYMCKKGYTMVGAPVILCINGIYNHEPPKCFADCGMQTNPRGTHGYLTHGQTGRLTCYEDLGFFLGGNGDVMCNDGHIEGDAKCYKPPSFQDRPLDGYVIENQDIVLKCIPDTDDSFVTWYRGENEVLLEDSKDGMSRISVTMNGTVLTIKQATFQDAGSYTCKISNPIGTATANARLRIIGVIQLPHIIKPLDHIVEYVGQNVQLRCDSTGDPTPNVTWFFEESPIIAGHSDMLVVDSTLLISRIEAKHSGRYTCVATNQYGTDSANCTLTVIDYPTDPPPEPEKVEFIKDSESQLRALLMCPYGGKAEEAVIWTFGGADLTSTLRRYTITNRRLIIHDANESDNGLYTCTVHTTKGRQTYRIILTIILSDSLPPKGLISSGEAEVLSDSGITNPPKTAMNSPKFRTTTMAAPLKYTTEPTWIQTTPSSSKQTNVLPELVPCTPCEDAPPKIKPRRRDINDTGIPYYFRGWVDVQGQGAANDYCRLINPTPNQLMLACALAGTQGQSQYNYVSTSNLDPGYKDTSYMKDEDGDGRDDYCRCVGAGKEMYVWCMKASVDGFAGKNEGGIGDDENGPSQYTFVAPGPRNILRKCRKRKVDPFFGEPV